MKKKITTVLLGILVIGLTVFIFSNSLTAGTESAEQSGRIVGIVKNILENTGISYDDYSLSFFIRKMGHFSEYFALGFVTAGFIRRFTEKKGVFSLSPVYCGIVALCDEFICQRITEGRSPQFTDVLIDIGGAVTGTLFLLAIILIVIKRKRRKT